MSAKQVKLVGVRLYLVMLGMLITGSANTIMGKIQNQTPGENGVLFKHPYVQCTVMFIGELLCLVAYGVKLLINMMSKKKDELTKSEIEEAKKVNLKTKINPLWLIIPALFDFICSVLMNISLILVAASVYQMLRAMIIIFAAGMSIMFFKRKLYRHHWSSMALIFIGVTLVGVAALTEEQRDET